MSAVKKLFAWPSSINTDYGKLQNPSPEVMRSLGYELYTPEELQQMTDAERQRLQDEQDAAQERLLRVQALRQEYRNATNAICAAAGWDNADKFEDENPIMQAFGIAQSNSDMEATLTIIASAIALNSLIRELRRLDDDDAWERI